MDGISVSKDVKSWVSVINNNNLVVAVGIVVDDTLCRRF